ncbi:MAG: fibronectin type III domain-containing protein [Chitinispirillales bacterium]|nr:fibronectin type III domain-containing protein [Chitinispirillales bacterium]
MFIRRRQALLSTVISACAVWILGCSDNLSVELSKEFAPDTPLIMGASAVSSSSITVNWAFVSGAMGYRVYRSTSSSGSYIQVGGNISSSSTSYTDNANLSPGTTYYYKVSACNGLGESPQSSPRNATTIINAPTNVSASSTSSSSITITWSPVSGAAGYRIYRGGSQVGSTSSTSYTENGLSPGTLYYYTVSAYKGNVESLHSSPPASVTTILNAPTNVNAISTSSSSISVTWASVDGAAGYRVYRNTSAGGTYEPVGSTSSTSYTDNGLSPGTTYYYKVSAYKGNVESSQSSYANATLDLDPPSSVSAISTSSSSISVSWSLVNGATGYRVYRSTSFSGSYYEIATRTSSSTSYTDNGLSPGTAYYYKVSAYNSNVESSQSYPPASATTSLPPPSDVSANSTSSSSISVSWSSVSGVTGYRVYRSTIADGTYSYIGSTSSTSHTDNGLSPGTTYYYKVSAYNGDVESSKSSSYASATTDIPAPSTPANVYASSTSSSSITISWSSVSGATEYRVYRSTGSSSNYYYAGTAYSTAYTDTGLSPSITGTTYYYKVSAYNSAGESQQSSPASATIYPAESEL